MYCSIHFGCLGFNLVIRAPGASGSVHLTSPDGLAPEDEDGNDEGNEAQVEDRVLSIDVADEAECRKAEVGFEDDGESPDLAIPLMKLDLASCS